MESGATRSSIPHLEGADSNLDSCLITKLSPELVKLDSTMGYLNPNSPGYEIRTTHGSIVRRILIIILLVAINCLLLSDWRPKSGTELAIRGGVGMRPLGEICYTDPHTRQKEVINNRYAVVFDAGSTGSRVHVYEFQYCGDLLKVLVDEVFEEVKPGLSHYHEDPRQAARSLRPLIKIALNRVPKKYHEYTPLIVKATAGLRLLSEIVVKKILENVRNYMTSYKFVLGDGTMLHEEAVNVMDGSEEGVFAWLTVNFLQNRLKQGSVASPFLSDETSVVMDLGGGSTQIVFAVPKATQPEIDILKYPRYYYRLKSLGNEIDLYQQSYLGYGLMEARKKIKIDHIQKILVGSSEHQALRFPCHPMGFHEHIQVENITVGLIGDSSGWDACLNVVTPIFRKEDHCILNPCAFNGIHQPSIRTRSFVAFSYFFDRLIPLGLSSPMTLFEIDREGRKLCRKAPGSRFGTLLEENPQWCLDLAYIYTLLRVGYQIDIDQPIIVTKQINGYEAGWALGAALKLLEGAKPYSKTHH